MFDPVPGVEHVAVEPLVGGNLHYLSPLRILRLRILDPVQGGEEDGL
ncbi:hypothetical protein ES703_57074 [subsurface metagenome]